MTDAIIQDRKARRQEAIDAAVRAGIAKMHTAIPGEVKRYDAATQTADIQPVIRRWLNTGESFPFALLLDVPVIHPQGSGYALHIPLVPGDRVLLIFSERSIEDYLVTGSPDVFPEDLRRFHHEDGFALAGFSLRKSTIPSSFASADGLTLGHQDGSAIIRIEEDGRILIGGDAIDAFAPEVRLGDALAEALSKAGITDANFATLAAAINLLLAQWNAAALTATTSGTPVPLVVPPGSAIPIVPAPLPSTATSKTKGS